MASIENFRPMLAATHEGAAGLYFPVIASPKIDGIRCITLPVANGVRQCLPVSRSLKRIRNQHIYDSISLLCPPGLDGELVVQDRPIFGDQTSAVMNSRGKPDFRFKVFDYIPDFEDPRHHSRVMTGYIQRLAMLSTLLHDMPSFVEVLPTTRCDCIQELQDYHDRMVAAGYEGACYRVPQGPYKFGRSSLREQLLVKMKLFADEPAQVIGVEELLRNFNAPETNALGYAERSSHKEGMVGGNMLGALVVRNRRGQFNIGTGFSEGQRRELWANRGDLIGRICKFKFQPCGMKDLPRCPVFVKFWEECDGTVDPRLLV